MENVKTIKNLDEKDEKKIQRLINKMKKDTFFFSHYDDIGLTYQFSLCWDDVLKKDMQFCNFTERFIKKIAMDVGVPIELIAFGKWGARLKVDFGDGNRKIAKYIYLIENHPCFKDYGKAMKVFTYGDYKDEQDMLAYFMNQINYLGEIVYECELGEKIYDSKKKEILKEAKEDLKEKEFNKLKEWCE